MNKVRQMETRRSNLATQWANTNLPEAATNQLNLMLQQNVLLLDNMDLKSKELQNENLMKHKDDYI
jgi:hypothetical protein